MSSHIVASGASIKYAITLHHPSRISAEVCISSSDKAASSAALLVRYFTSTARGRVTFPTERAVAKVSVDPAQGKASDSWLPAPSWRLTPNLILVGGTSNGKTYLATGWAWLRSIRKQMHLYNAVVSSEPAGGGEGSRTSRSLGAAADPAGRDDPG